MTNKKLLLLVFLFSFLFFIIPLNTADKNISIINRKDFNARVSKTVYKDWGNIEILDSAYSYSTLFLTEDTEFIVYKQSSGKKENRKTPSGKILPNFYDMTEGPLIFLITNCAINEKGEILDVLIKLDGIKLFEDDSVVQLGIFDRYRLLRKQSDPAHTYYEKRVDIGDPIIFDLFTTRATCSFSMTYYKTGTYDYKTNTGVYGEIKAINGYYTDFDIVVHHSGYGGKFMAGNEGVRPDEGSSTIVYNKNKYHISASGFRNYNLQERDNGIAISTAGTNTNGFWYASSALILTTNISNSYFQFTYGGDSCGIVYLFVTPYPYKIDTPLKSASVEEALCGDSFDYVVSQYVPNNYYGSLLSFSELYKNLYGNTRLTALKIGDTIDDKLILDKDNIKIYNENEVDASDYFNVEVNGNQVTATATTAALENYAFYNHTYNLKIPVTVKDGLYDVDFIPNVGKSTSKLNGDDPEDKDTPEVDVTMRYRLTVNYYNEATGEKIVESDYSDNYYNGDPYTTNRNKVGEEWDLVDDPPNMNGVIHEDTVVNYYFIRFHTLPVTGGNGIKYVIIVGLILLMISLIIVLILIRKKVAKQN